MEIRNWKFFLVRDSYYFLRKYFSQEQKAVLAFSAKAKNKYSFIFKLFKCIDKFHIVCYTVIVEAWPLASANISKGGIKIAITEVGARVKVEVPRSGGGLPITTMGGHDGATIFSHFKKSEKSGRYLFGTVEAVCKVQPEQTETVMGEKGPVLDEAGNLVKKVVQDARYTALVRWDGPKYRTSTLPVEMLRHLKSFQFVSG
ncbi:MAG: hypothetical protein HYW69_01645 [Candidatus Nealsonbacteria bacterium]|nr:hypothetical protein [Candidatus Nealsonbacteria bacterium]